MKKETYPYLQRRELLTRLQFQDQVIRSFEKEIYENVGQVLCLARIKLGCIDLRDRNRSAKILEESGHLIGQAIIDLRNLAKQSNNNEQRNHNPS